MVRNHDILIMSNYGGYIVVHLAKQLGQRLSLMVLNYLYLFVIFHGKASNLYLVNVWIWITSNFRNIPNKMNKWYFFWYGKGVCWMSSILRTHRWVKNELTYQSTPEPCHHVHTFPLATDRKHFEIVSNGFGGQRMEGIGSKLHFDDCQAPKLFAQGQSNIFFMSCSIMNYTLVDRLM